MVPLLSLMLPVMIAAFLDIFASSLTGTDLFLMLSILPYLQSLLGNIRRDSLGLNCDRRDQSKPQ